MQKKSNTHTTNETHEEIEKTKLTIPFILFCLSATSSINYLVFNIDFLLVISSFLTILILIFAMLVALNVISYVGTKPVVESEIDLALFIFICLTFLATILSLITAIFRASL